MAFLKRDIARFIDTAPPPKLAAWATTGLRTTGAYLCQIAREHGMLLATFDTRIKDSAPPRF
jgi:hypothetical protein